MNKPNFGYWRFEYRYNDGQWKTFTHYGHRPGTADNVRGIRPLYEHPAPAQPATDPAVEAARRKALRAIFAKLGEWPWACDTATGTELPFGVLRDLVGQSRKDPARRITGYDEEPKDATDATGMRHGQVPAKGPEQPVPMSEPVEPALSVRTLAETILACSTDARARRRAWHDASISQQSRAVSGAKALRRILYGRGT